MEIYDLSNVPEDVLENIGGKAKGLALLASYGFNTPKGNVVRELDSDDDYEKAAVFYELHGSRCVAVRSSAGAEDGSDFSSAGQYASVLNVRGKEGFISALKECVASLGSETAESYSSFFADARSAAMNVVVQEMVDAACAGVCFTIDPSTGANNVIIEAVEGLGESLVSGMAAAEHFEIPCKSDDNGEVHLDIPDRLDSTILTREMLITIAEQALEAAECFGYPLDMEWAVDRSGQLVWLQARPVTTDREIGIDELDHKGMPADTVFTNCNIGEMLPGAVTPLSLSTSVMGIDMGLRRMLVTAGAYRNMDEVPICITNFSNQLFFNLTAIYKMGYTIIGADRRNVENSICGKTLDTPDPDFKHINVIRKAFNATRYGKFLFSRKKAMKRLDRMADTFAIEPSDDIVTYFNRIDAEVQKCIDSAWYHYITSSYSGAMSSTLLTIIKSGMDDREARSLMAGLLEDIDDIESVDILRSMRRLASAVAKEHPDAGNMTPAGLEEVVLSSQGEVREAYEYFIKRHGHRGIREAEMRSPSWAGDSESLFGNVLTIINSGSFAAKEQASQFESCREQLLAGKKGMGRKGLDWLLRQARTGVYCREYTKARYIKVLDVFKQAYKRLGGMMAEAGALPDADLIYFLSHDELRDLAVGKKGGLVKTALKRRRLLPQQQLVKYKDVYIGEPVPIRPETVAAGNGTVLTGAPISRGEVTGKARVVTSVEDAKKLENGEIMVAAFTDIGWSPYYSVIGGLITEVGSALSHGAVVAREYGLPLVVNVANATGTIRTGDLVMLDATGGRVVIIESASVTERKERKEKPA